MLPDLRTETDDVPRSSAPPRGGPPSGAARLLVSAAVAAGVFQAFRTAARVRREIAAYRVAAARLETVWTTVRGIAGSSPVRVHARVHAGARGPQAPVVLVHGYGVASSYFVPLAARLAGRVRVYAPDLPGHGWSDHDRRALTLPELAEALARWMDARGLCGAVLVGHSFGCQIAAELAGRRPDLAAGLVLVGPTCDPAARSPAHQIARAATTAFFESPSVVLLGGLCYLQVGPGVLVAEMRALVGHRLDHALPAIARPIRLMRGEHDHIAPQPWVDALARLVDAPPATVVPGWGHAVQYSDPERVAATVVELAYLVGEPAAAPGHDRCLTTAGA